MPENLKIFLKVHTNKFRLLGKKTKHFLSLEGFTRIEQLYSVITGLRITHF